MKKVMALIFFLPVFYLAQELEARVDINYEQLPNAYKDKIVGFGQQVSDYLNSTQFTGRAWEWQRIKCSFNIFFTSGSGETKYSAQVVITSQRPIEGLEKSTLMLSIMDNSWQFEYEKNQPLYFNQTDFDPLTSFLDFYAYLILGIDSDSYEPFAGSEFYKECLNITVLGSNTAYADSWILKSTSYNKRALIEDLLDANYQRFRKNFTDYHYNGLDVYYRDKSRTYESIKNLVKDLEDLKKKINKRSVLMNVFFDAKSGEIISYMKEAGDESIFETLKQVDPARISKYIEATES